MERTGKVDDDRVSTLRVQCLQDRQNTESAKWQLKGVFAHAVQPVKLSTQFEIRRTNQINNFDKMKRALPRIGNQGHTARVASGTHEAVRKEIQIERRNYSDASLFVADRKVVGCEEVAYSSTVVLSNDRQIHAQKTDVIEAPELRCTRLNKI